MQKRDGRAGFTLLEVLIVLVILAVLAGLAITSYQGLAEKARAKEARHSLMLARDSAIRYFTIANTYVGSTYTPGQPGTLDFDPNIAVGGQTVIFAYTISGLTANTFLITATRTGGPVGTVSINQAGTLTYTGVYI